MQLTNPIQAHGESVSELTFREPGGKDIRTCGLIYNSSRELDTEAAARYISALAAIPMSSVDQLNANDFLAAAAEVVGFFGPSAPATPAPPETATSN